MTRGASRRYKRVTVALLCAGGAIVVVGGFFLLRPRPTPVKSAPDVAFVESVVEVDAELAYARLAERLQTELRRVQKFRRTRVSALLGRMPVYQHSAETKRYAALKPPTTPEDLYVTVTSMGWESEYYARGKRLPFRTDFIIHVEALGPSRTRIEVIENNPMVTVGERFLPIGRHIVPEFQAVRVKVAPTATERREVLGLAVAITHRDKKNHATDIVLTLGKKGDLAQRKRNVGRQQPPALGSRRRLSRLNLDLHRIVLDVELES